MYVINSKGDDKMKRRTFLKGLLAAPCLMLPGYIASAKPEARKIIGIDPSSGDDHTSVWVVEWGEDGINKIFRPPFYAYGSAGKEHDTFCGLAARYK